MVIKVLSDVTYQFQSEKSKPGCRKQTFVVHFKYLKPCQIPILETQQEGEPNEINREQAKISDNEKNVMTLIQHPTTQEGEAQPSKPAEHYGPTWGGRLRRTTHPPDYYASHIHLYTQVQGRVFQERESCTKISQRQYAKACILIDNT